MFQMYPYKQRLHFVKTYMTSAFAKERILTKDLNDNFIYVFLTHFLKIFANKNKEKRKRTKRKRKKKKKFSFK